MADLVVAVVPHLHPSSSPLHQPTTPTAALQKQKPMSEAGTSIPGTAAGHSNPMGIMMETRRDMVPGRTGSIPSSRNSRKCIRSTASTLRDIRPRVRSRLPRRFTILPPRATVVEETR
jgi:hypothetical protein